MKLDKLKYNKIIPLNLDGGDPPLVQVVNKVNEIVEYINELKLINKLK